MSRNKKNSNTEKLLTYKDAEDLFNGFKSDKERIKYISQAYKKYSIAEAFAIYYEEPLSEELSKNTNINNVIILEVGGTYSGSVKNFTDGGNIIFEIPGVKEEIISQENFNSCRESIEQYLLTHDNKLLFEVRKFERNRFVVSVTTAYYNKWRDSINKAIINENGIKVHIDELVKGGYICHTDIWNLNEVTGKHYTHSVFIPGSHIVLNIEKDFEKWIGEEVMIVPQKFVEFRRDIKTGLIENSLVGSRKRVLQIIGMKNIYDIYNDYKMREKLAEKEETKEITYPSFEGTVTGIINSNKKIGIFIELDDKYITGLMPIDSSELLNYFPGDKVTVRIKEFEIQEGKEPFEIKKKIIKKCNVRPVFEIV